MKKTFPLQVPGKTDERVVEAIKFDVRKYVKRERRKRLPDGFDRWDFACKVGPEQATAPSKTIEEVIPAIDAVAQTGSPHVYIEILAAAGHRAVPAPTEVPSPPTTPLAPQL